MDRASTRLGLDLLFDDLWLRLDEEGALALDLIERVSQLLFEWRPDAGREIEGAEEQLADLHDALDRAVETTLARQAPVASDLRLVLAILRANHHLERIGHHAVRIAATLEEPLVESVGTSLLAAMADRSVLVARDGLTAFRERDPDAFDDVRALDAEIDRLNVELIQASIDEAADPAGTEATLRALAVARRLERVGDHGLSLAGLAATAAGRPRRGDDDG